MIVFVANVGDRDIMLNVGDDINPMYYSFDKGGHGKELKAHLGCDEGTRAISSHIRKNRDKFSNHLIFPILGRALEFSLTKVSKLDRVLLFATDQPEMSNE